MFLAHSCKYRHILFQIFGGPKSSVTVDTVQSQIDLFSSAKIILGPHGAGLTNMIWAQNGTSVIEFALKPHANRNFGMLAMMCGHDYWLLPEIRGNYYKKYQVDEEGVASLVTLLQRIIDARNPRYLYRKSRDEL